MKKNDDIVTLCAKGNWHFFLRKSCNDFVYLSFSLRHSDVPRGTNITYEAPVEIRMPISVWREMVSSWESTEWSSDPKLDNVTTFGKKILDGIIKSQN